jgi:hypothetical protein
MTATRSCAAAACFAALLAGCGQAPPEPEASPIASTVHVGDPKAAGQLVSGFYGIEENSWRWTSQKFSILLHPPAGSAQKGAILVVSFTIAEGTINQFKDFTLSASIGGAMLAPQTYTRAGAATYVRDVPPGVLGSPSVQVDFQLDKALPPAGKELRTLGIVAQIIGLEPK